MPSYSEMMEIFGYRSKNSVAKLVAKLTDQGVIRKDNGKIAPVALYGPVRVLGTVAAGFPTPAEEELSDTMTLDEWLIGNKEATFMLTVSGDSMKDAGIIEGDVVLVERTNAPKVGQIVIAEVDGRWTMKYLHKTGNTYFLRAANKKYKDIYPEEELHISAVVKAVIRKY